MGEGGGGSRVSSSAFHSFSSGLHCFAYVSVFLFCFVFVLFWFFFNPTIEVVTFRLRGWLRVGFDPWIHWNDVISLRHLCLTSLPPRSGI